MKQEPDHSITLPSGLYHQLRSEAHRRNLTLPEFLQKKMKLQQAEAAALGELPLKDIMARTEPPSLSPDARLDFYS